MLKKLGLGTNKMALRLLKISEFCLRFMIILPIITVLYQDKGVSVGDFFLIQGIFALSCFLFEIPSGYLSDRFSRKKVMILGGLVALMSDMILYFAYGFWQIILVEVLLGIADALFSGTQEAYTYDLLKRENQQGEFLREFGAVSTWSQASGFIATIVGGLIFVAMGVGIVAIQAGMAVLSICCMMLLPELTEVRRTVSHDTNPFKDVLGIVKMSVRHPELKWLMLFPAMFGSFTLVMMWILQPTMQTTGVSVALFGLFVGLNQFMRVVYSKFAHKIYDWLGARRVMIGLIGMLIISVISVILALHTNNMWLIYGFCVIIACVPAAQKLCALVFNTQVHHRTESKERGTVLSVGSMYVMGCNGGMMILMKPLIDGYGIQWTMVVLLCMITILIIPLHKVWKMNIK